MIGYIKMNMMKLNVNKTCFR